MPFQPVIGLTPSIDRAENRVWIRPAYMSSVLAAGGLPVLLPLTDAPEALSRMLDLCDGILLTGGPDADPALYGGSDPGGTVFLCPDRDAMELPLARMAIAADKPLLAICRGIQVLNVALGGSLWVDLPTERPSALRHRQGAPGAEPTHGVRALPDTPLSEICGQEALRVNSLHHQAIRELAPGLSPMAEAEDGLIEAVWRPESRFAMGVQWHPELMSAHDEASRAIFRRFVEAAARAR